MHHINLRILIPVNWRAAEWATLSESENCQLQGNYVLSRLQPVNLLLEDIVEENENLLWGGGGGRTVCGRCSITGRWVLEESSCLRRGEAGGRRGGTRGRGGARGGGAAGMEGCRMPLRKDRQFVGRLVWWPSTNSSHQHHQNHANTFHCKRNVSLRDVQNSCEHWLALMYTKFYKFTVSPRYVQHTGAHCRIGFVRTVRKYILIHKFPP